MSKFSQKIESQKSKIILEQLCIKILTEKIEVLAQIAKVSGKKIETMDQKVHTF